MNTVYVLIANSDRRMNNLIEVAVRDVCYEQLLVECSITGRLDEALHRGCVENVGLIFLAPNHVVIGPPQRAVAASLNDATRCIQTIKRRRSVLIMAVGVRSDNELELLEAGADSVFGILFDRDKLRFEIRRGLGLQEQLQESEPPSRWSIANSIFRGLGKPRQN
jgi:hypothetical protein